LYRSTGQAPYAALATREMEAAAAFSDWNPSHFLDTAEATAAMAIGLDWLGDALTPRQRETFATAIVQLGLRLALNTQEKYNFWQTAEHNWNQVCWGGMVLGALAVRHTHAQIASQILQLAQEQYLHGTKPYAPDGLYPEGPSYWGYGTSYTVLMLAALRTALGDAASDWKIEQQPGFLASAEAYVQIKGPSGLSFNFSDGPERILFEPMLFWFAKALGQTDLLQFELAQLAQPASRTRALQSRFAPLIALWWPALQRREHNTLALNWQARGKNPVVVVRDSWTDASSTFVAIKGGSASLNHAHMDVGSFVLEMRGVRWVIDLGLQAYESLESKGVDLWSKKQYSQRWQVFRLNNFAHSTLTINDQLHQVAGTGTFTQVNLDAHKRFVQLEMGSVFQGQASAVSRSLRLQDGAVIIRDELAGLKAGAVVRWQLPTRANLMLDGAQAKLQQSGQQLMARLKLLDSTEQVAWKSISVEQPMPDFNATNPGVRLLMTECKAPANGKLSIEVTMSAS
jgi:oligo-alginate lyase